MNRVSIAQVLNRNLSLKMSQKLNHRLAKRYKGRRINNDNNSRSRSSSAEREMYKDRKTPIPVYNIDDDSDDSDTEIVSQEWDDATFKQLSAEERAILLLYVNYDTIIQTGLKDRYLTALRGFKADRIAKNRYLDLKDPNTVINQRFVNYVRSCFFDEDRSFTDNRKELLDTVCKFPYPTGILTRSGVILYTCSGSFHVREMVTRDPSFTRFAPDLLCAYVQYIEDLEAYKARLADVKPNQQHDAEDKAQARNEFKIIDMVEYKPQ